MNYHVVRFMQSNQVEIISNNWVKTIGICMFPNVLRNAASLAKKHAEVSSDWLSYDIKMLYTTR